MNERADAHVGSRGTKGLWAIVAVVVGFGVLLPAFGEAASFSSGYANGCDWPMQPTLATLVLLPVLLVFALANLFYRGVRWRHFALALAVHAVAIAAGNGVVHRSFHAMVRGSVTRAQAVVDAIHDFEKSHGRAPASLSELVPEYFHREPSSLYSDGPILWYEPTRPDSSLPPGEWAIRPNVFESVKLTYVPTPSARLLLPSEQRIGDWIVEAHEPWGSMNPVDWVSQTAERASKSTFGSGAEMCARCGARRDVRTKDGVRTLVQERDSPERAWADPRIGACREHLWQEVGGWSSCTGSVCTCTGYTIANEHVLWRALSVLDAEQAEAMARRYGELPPERMLELWTLAHELRSSPERSIALAVATRAGWSDMAAQ